MALHGLKTKNNMKVAIITSWLNRVPNNLMDSTGIFVKEQARAIQDLDIETVILFPDLMPNWDAPFFSPKRRLDIENDIPTFRIQQFHPPKWSSFLLNSFIKKAITLYDDYFSIYGKPDLIHAHNYWVGFVALAIKEKYGIPFVFTEHDTVFFEGRFRCWLIPLFTKMLHEASAITVVSKGLKEVLSLFSDKHINIVPNVINTEIFKSKVSAYKRNISEKDKILRFVSVGSLYSYKGYDLLLPAFAQFLNKNPDSRVCLSIIGEGKERKNLAAQTGKLALSQFVTFKGQLSTKEIVQSLNQADVFISSSRFETFGVAMAEAMAIGLPILATPTDGAKEILTIETGILISTISIPDIVDGLEKMYFEYKKFDAQKIRQHVLDNFDKTIVAQQYFNIYRKIILTNMPLQ